MHILYLDPSRMGDHAAPLFVLAELRDGRAAPVIAISAAHRCLVDYGMPEDDAWALIAEQVRFGKGLVA